MCEGIRTQSHFSWQKVSSRCCLRECLLAEPSVSRQFCSTSELTNKQHLPKSEHACLITARVARMYSFCLVVVLVVNILYNTVQKINTFLKAVRRLLSLPHWTTI